MDKHFTDVLRESSQDWSLDGDRKLLNQLKEVHKRVISNAADTCTNLNESISNLEEANINLQNVSNRFTALSKTQFVESRVYEDDTDLRKEVTSSKISASVTSSDIPSITDLSYSLNVLESRHVPLLLDMDSDSENDEVTTHNEILELKDPYENSPLPHLIGSENWKNKSHVGIIEDSDNDVSESEDETSDNPPEPDNSETTPNSSICRESSGPLASWCENQNQTVPETVATKPVSQSDLAAELARKLGGGTKPPEMPAIPEDIQPQQVSNKVYKPPEYRQQAVIFFDAPPALDPNDQSESSESEPEDIFAEINRSVPYSNRNKYDNHTPVHTNKTDSGTLSDDGNKNVFVSKNKPLISDIDNDDSTVGSHEKESHKQTIPEKQGKKPAGAISLFGSKLGAESIGAAIISRNRKQSSSDEESNDSSDKSTSKNIGEKSTVTKQIQATNEIKTHKDVSNKPTSSSAATRKPIADDILSSLLQPRTSKNNDKVTKTQDAIDSPQLNVIKPNKTVKKIGWLDDDIFDDIDDIFTSQPNIVKINNTNKKVIDKFDDDLFGSISKNPNKVDKNLFLDSAIPSGDSKAKSANNLKSMFEHDKTASNKANDDLFGDDNSSLKDDDLFSVIKASSKASSVTKQIEHQDLQNHENNTSDICNDEEKQIVDTMVSKSNEDVCKNDENNSPVAALNPNALSYSLDTSHEPKQGDKIVIKDVIECDTNAFENVGINDNISTGPQYIIQKAETHTFDSGNRAAISKNEQVISKPSEPETHKEYMIRDTIDTHILKLNTSVGLQSTKPSENEIKPNPPSNIIAQNFLNDIINDIPPVLESDEPKKQRNINALFDDDFNDEELFFKKPVNISDEKPVISKESISVFHDEPPDFDVVDDIFLNPKTKEQNITKTSDPIPQTSQTLEAKRVIVNKAHIESENNEVLNNREQKVVSKLKQPNININVQTLLPGASMSIKKENITKRNTAPTEEITSKIFNKTTEPITLDVNKHAEEIIKTISFESETKTSILNNSMSKERPKIQVKRRPSTRRARIEASRNSTIDFPDTSTTDDDSNNDTHRGIDKPIPIPTSTTVTKVNSDDDDDVYDTQVLNINDQDTYIMKNPIHNKSISIDVQNKNTDTPKQDEVSTIEQNVVINVTDNVLTKKKEKVEKDLQQTSDENCNPLESTVTSKPIIEVTKKSPNVNKDNPQKSLFGDSSDDDLELFGKSTTKSKVKKKVTKSLFDDDDDDDALFTSKQKKIKIDSRIDSKKKPLFSDDEDDSLFGPLKPAQDKK